MCTIIAVNATQATEYCLMPFAGGPSSFERIMNLATSITGSDRVLVLTGPVNLPCAGSQMTTVSAASWTMQMALKEIAGFAAGHPDADALLYLHADMPYTDSGLCNSLLALHRRYRAEYTFADGYPPGFAPEVLSPKVLPNLAELAVRFDAPADRDGLFAVIQKDINSYDIETELSPVDLRGLRFLPLCDTRRNMMAAEALHALGVRSAADAVRVLPDHPELLRTLPAFLWVQIAEGCPQACAYCPYPAMVGDPRGKTGFMPVDRFAHIMHEAAALCDDLVVDVSLWGEPAMHPDFGAIAAAVLDQPHFSLIVETSGLGWPAGLAESIATAAGPRINWIVSIDEADAQAYERLRGTGYDEAVAFASRLSACCSGLVHVQAVRMTDNEERLETFYRHWKKTLDKVIIQKYDSFCGLLPDRTVAELAPLERLPCRHLARDMAILMDGSVPACKHCLVREDITSSLDAPTASQTSRTEVLTGGLVSTGHAGYANRAANVFVDGFAGAWKRTGDWYRRHCAADYPEPCRRCDEFHTFNA